MTHTVISLQTTTLSEFASLVQTGDALHRGTLCYRYSKVLIMLFMEEMEVLSPFIWEQTLVKIT